jgi:hypothetical protein
MQALRAMYPEDEGCFILAPAEQEALAAAAAHSPGARGTINLSGTIKLPGVLLEQQPVSLRFQLPPGYPSAEPPQLSVECSATRWGPRQDSRTGQLKHSLHTVLGQLRLPALMQTKQLTGIAAAACACASAGPSMSS